MIETLKKSPFSLNIRTSEDPRPKCARSNLATPLEVDHTRDMKYTPITRYRSDPITGEQFIHFDFIFHLRARATIINLGKNLMINSIKVS